MQTLTIENLTLEPQTAEHAEEMFVLLSDPSIYEFENEPPSSLEWLRQRFEKLESRESADGEQRWLNWVIRVAPSGALAGYVQATILQDASAFVGYELGSAFWGKSIARRAVEAMLLELRKSYGVRQCLAVYKTANFRSERLLKRLGFSAAPESVVQSLHLEPDECVMLLSTEAEA